MRHILCQQRSAEWLKARSGRITASRMADVLDRLKRGDEGAKRRNYRIELAAERLTGRSEDHFVSREMEWGMEYEDLARAAYEAHAGVLTEEVGFLVHPRFDFAGASPDALVGNDGGIEIKCPKTTTHINSLLSGLIPDEYLPQMAWNMICAERVWWDFVSYDPRMPEGKQLFVKRMTRDEDAVRALEAEVERMHADVENIVEALHGPEWKPYWPSEAPDTPVEYIDGIPADIGALLDAAMDDVP